MDEYSPGLGNAAAVTQIRYSLCTDHAKIVAMSYLHEGTALEIM